MIGVFSALKGRFGELVANMSPRDRKLFVGLVLGFYLFSLGGLWWLANGVLDGQRSRVAAAELTLSSVRELAADEGAAAGQLARIDEQMARYAGQDLASFVEKAAQEVGVATNLQGVRERQAVTEGLVEEHSYSVELSKISLQQLVEFLYEIETTGYPLKVRSMKTKVVTVSGVKMLNVSLDLSAFKLVAVAAEAKAG